MRSDFSLNDNKRGLQTLKIRNNLGANIEFGAQICYNIYIYIYIYITTQSLNTHNKGKIRYKQFFGEKKNELF